MVQEKSFREDLYYRLNVVRIKTPALRERMEDLPELVDFMLQRLNKEQSTGTAEISKEAMEILGKYNWPGNVRELENVLHSSSVISKGKRILSKDLPSTLISDVGETSSMCTETPETTNGSVITKSEENTNPPRSAGSDPENNLVNRINFGVKNSNVDSDAQISSAPNSISSEESFDIAYAHARQSSDRNLIETVEKEIIQRALKECGGNQVKASALLGITRATLRKRIDVFEIRY
jgi:two-component system nitrogen regulation response regulator GlnG